MRKIFTRISVPSKGLYVVENDRVRYLTEGNWIRCSVCGFYMQKDEFFGPDEDHSKFTRTNCFKCYNLQISEYDALNDQTKKLNTYSMTSKLDHEAGKENNYLNAISVGDFIDMLSKYPKDMKIMSPMIYDTEDGESEPYPPELFIENYVNGKQVVRMK